MEVQSQPRPEPRFRLHRADELDDLPPMRWVIEDFLPEQGLGVLFGPPGGAKTFFAVDAACSVAAGITCHGKEVIQGQVVYIVTEGIFGIRKRVRAWMKARGVAALDDAFFVKEAVEITSPAEVAEFVGQIRTQGVRPALIVIDTFAKCFSGDENTSKDVGQFVRMVQRIQRDTGAAVLIVHHTTKQKGRRSPDERGSSALRGAADTMLRISKQGQRVDVCCDKQKDAEEFSPLKLRLKPILLEDEETTCVLVAGDGPQDSLLAPEHRRALAVLRAFGVAASSGDWRRGLGEVGKEVPERTFHNWRDALVEAGLVQAIKRGIYQVTDLGAATAMAMRSAHRSSFPSSAATAPPLKGVQEQEGGRSEGIEPVSSFGAVSCETGHQCEGC